MLKVAFNSGIKPKVVFLHVLLFFSIPFQSISQSDTAKRSIGLGYFKWSPVDHFFNLSHAWKKQNQKELAASISYFNGENRYAILSAIEYHWAIVKRSSKFNIHFGPSFDYLYFNRQSRYAGKNEHGPFLSFNIIPGGYVTRHVRLSIEGKLGYGYVWNSGNFYQDSDYFEILAIPLVKLSAVF